MTSFYVFNTNDSMCSIVSGVVNSKPRNMKYFLQLILCAEYSSVLMFFFSFMHSTSSIIGHCLIEHRESGFGFAEPFFIHATLRDLVLHYRETSLAEHNDLLDITLNYPVHAITRSHEFSTYQQASTYQRMQ